MNNRTFVLYFVVFAYKDGECVIRDFTECHVDYSLRLQDGVLHERNVYSWLGFLQYLHVTIGVPHISLAPRVILVQKQFVLATTRDLYHIPKQYQLGSIIFGHYEMDEHECKLQQSQANIGIGCGPAYMEIPFEKIITNPEYSRFGAESLALVKLIRPLKSHYMVPVCLPTLTAREKQRLNKTVIMIDYLSEVPTDFDEEKMAVKTLMLYTDRDCRRLQGEKGLERNVTHALCTSGCGVRAGAPIVSHAANGGVQLVGISASSGHCTTGDMRDRLNKDPCVYIDIYPYVNWIVNVITAHVIPMPYPTRGFRRSWPTISDDAQRKYKPGLRTQRSQKEGWSRRTYFVGNWCYETRTKQRESLHYCYAEKFEAKIGINSKLRIILKISTGVETVISCVRITLPSQMTTPVVEGVGTFEISIVFPTKWFPENFDFLLVLLGKRAGHELHHNKYVKYIEQSPAWWYVWTQ